MYEDQVKKTEQLERLVYEYEKKVKEVQSENFDIYCDNQNLQEEIASRKSLCDHFEMLNKEHYDELQKVKFKAMRSISKLAREKKDLKKENERMSTYLESREIMYCDKCRKYGDYDHGCGDFVYDEDTCQYICHDCN